MRSGTLLALLSAAVLLLVPSVCSESDSLPTPDLQYNYNSYSITLFYTGGTIGDITVEWTAEGELKAGGTMMLLPIGEQPSADNDWTVSYDPEDVEKCKAVYITQKVTREGESKQTVIKIVIVDPPPSGGKYTVTFFDGYSGATVATDEVSEGRYIPIGGDYVLMPPAPVREGYSFLGWFVNADLSKPFDSKKPVTQDTSVFAMWTKESGSPDPDADPNDPGAYLVSLTVGGDYKTEYTVGERLNTTGMAVMAVYSNTAKVEVTSQCTFTPSKFSDPGIVDVEVSYKDVSTSFRVTVAENYVPGGDSDDPETPDGPEPDIPDGGSDGTWMYVLAGIVAVAVIAAVAAVYLRKHRT